MHGMIPNSKQRKDTINRSKPSRRKAAMLFNPNKYALSDIIEGIFGAEETQGHQIYCRFVGDDNRKQFAKGGHILEHNGTQPVPVGQPPRHTDTLVWSPAGGGVRYCQWNLRTSLC